MSTNRVIKVKKRFSFPDPALPDVDFIFEISLNGISAKRKNDATQRFSANWRTILSILMVHNTGNKPIEHIFDRKEESEPISSKPVTPIKRGRGRPKKI